MRLLRSRVDFELDLRLDLTFICVEVGGCDETQGRVGISRLHCGLGGRLACYMSNLQDIHLYSDIPDFTNGFTSQHDI